MEKEPSPLFNGTRFEINHDGTNLHTVDCADGSVMLWLQREGEKGNFVATFKDGASVAEFFNFLLSLEPQFVHDWEVRINDATV